MIALVIIPLISTTTIFSLASLSSVMTSSSFGPTARAWGLLPWRTLLAMWPMLLAMLSANSTRSTRAKIIQARPPLRGVEAGGGTMIGGGVNGGGGVTGGGGGVTGGGSGGTDVDALSSILGANYLKAC